MPLVPLPTVTSILPARPAVAIPEPSSRCPLFPAEEDPEENTSRPEEPDAPALALRISTAPLVDAVPSPEDIKTAPPVCRFLCRFLLDLPAEAEIHPGGG